MDRPYLIAPDACRGLVTIGFRDTFWDDEIKRQFVADCVTAIASLGVALGTQRVLVDLRNAILQSQTLIATMQKFVANPLAGRIALVAETPLARMQTRRLQMREDVRMFPDIADAESWLFAPAFAAPATTAPLAAA